MTTDTASAGSDEADESYATFTHYWRVTLVPPPLNIFGLEVSRVFQTKPSTPEDAGLVISRLNLLCTCGVKSCAVLGLSSRATRPRMHLGPSKAGVLELPKTPAFWNR
jgi:hypothetical protein